MAKALRFCFPRTLFSTHLSVYESLAKLRKIDDKNKQLENCLSKRYLLQRAKNPKSVLSVLKERYLFSKCESSFVDFANSPDSKSLSG